MLLLNGNFWTADTLQPKATAVAVAGTRILYVGDEAGARAFATDSTKVIDLQGAFATPGFIEGHGHFISLGRSLENLNLMHTTSWEEIVQMAAEKAKSVPPGDWIEGRGWHQEKWKPSMERTVNGYPFHDALSAATPNNPMVLGHASGHALMANARAMELAGITGETADPVGGRIVRDASGRLTGVFEENAMDLIFAPLKAWKDKRPEGQKQADFDRASKLASDQCLARGITSFQDAGSDFWEIEQFQRLAESGQLPLRMWVMVAQPGVWELPKLLQFPKIDLGDQHLTVRAVKCYFDGALGSYGAWLLAAYNDKPNFFGQNTTPLDTVRAIAAACKANGLQMCVHAIGDRGNREVLNVFADFAAPDARWRVEHAQHLDPDDISRFKQLGVVASMQAIHCTSDAPFVVKRLGEKRAREGAYAWRSLLDSGAHLANGTDAPVEDVDPLPCLYAAVTRKRADTGLEFFPEQAMTREEGLLSYTRWNAWAAREDQQKGMLKAGMLADITVWSENLLDTPPAQILTAKTKMTIVGGKVLFAQ